MPVLAKMKTVTGRIWTYVRDDRPFGGKDPPAAVFRYSRTRAGEHPQEHLASYVGIMQADAFPGFNPLYDAKRRPAPIIEAACWSHGRRYFFKLAQETKAPIALEAVRRIDELFEIERTINGLTPQQRVAVRQAQSKPLVADLGDAYRRWHGGVVRDLMGGSPEEVPERYAVGDPIRLLPLDMPVVIIHGTDDETVSIKISRSYAESARAAGGEVELVEIEGPAGRHRAHLDPRGAAWAAVVARLDDPTAPVPAAARAAAGHL